MKEHQTFSSNSRFTPDREATRRFSRPGMESRMDQNKSSKFTSLVGDKAVSPTQREIRTPDEDSKIPMAGDVRLSDNVCPRCAGTVKRSSRMILSIPAGIGLILLGTALMVFYGYATNFYQFPWFVRFALPAAYYLGSIFLGVGIVFFFVRERIWRCRDCGRYWKR